MFFYKAAIAFIATLLNFISIHTPERTNPLTWEETLSNLYSAANNGDRNAIEMIVFSYFPGQEEEASKIITCESNWNPQIVSQTGDTGIFQINEVHQRSGALAEGLDLTDVLTNVKIARQLYEGRGWYPWSCRYVL